MILKYYMDKVATKVQVTDETEKLVFVDYVNVGIERIMMKLPELLYAETTVDTVIGENEINLPTDFWQPVILTSGNLQMVKKSRWDFYSIRPNPAGDGREQPFYYDIIGMNLISTTITGACEIVSSNASDTQSFTMYGEDSDGNLLNDEVSVNGDTPVALSADFAKFYYGTLDEKTLGRIDIRYVSGSIVINRINPNNLYKSLVDYKNILWIYPYPDAIYSIRVKYYKNIPKLESLGENQLYLKPIFDDYIINRAYIEHLYNDGQEALASSLEAKWNAEVDQKVAIERRLMRQDLQQKFSIERGNVYPQFDPLNRWH